MSTKSLALLSCTLLDKEGFLLDLQQFSSCFSTFWVIQVDPIIHHIADVLFSRVDLVMGIGLISLVGLFRDVLGVRLVVLGRLIGIERTMPGPLRSF